MTGDGNDWGSLCTATEAFRNLDCNSGNLKDFFCRNRRRPPGLHGLEKRLYGSGMPLVLSPSPEASKSRIAKAAQHTEVFQLKNPPRGKHLNTLLRKGPMPIGVILNGGNRTVLKLQRNLRSIRTGRNAMAIPHCTAASPHNPRAHEEARQINEVTSLS